jgi:hypothetical protein
MKKAKAVNEAQCHQSKAWQKMKAKENVETENINIESEAGA